MKVLGVGYPRTGTKTLGGCFRVFGYRHASWDAEIYEKYLGGDYTVKASFGHIRDLPKNKLGADLFRNLKVYVGPEHRQEAQKPRMKRVMPIISTGK